MSEHKLKEVKALLGLAEEDRVTELASAETPRGDVGQGYAPAPDRALGAGADLLASLHAEPDFSAVRAITGQVPGLAVRRWDADPLVLVVDGIPLLGPAIGAVERAEGDTWVADARTGLAALLFEVGGREWMLCADSASVELMAVERHEKVDAWAQHLGSYEPPPLPALEVPAPVELLGGMTTVAWLLERAGSLATSGSIFDRVASIGLLARLGAGCATDPKAALSARLAGAEGPAARAARWARALPPAVADELTRLTLEEAGGLAEAVEVLMPALAHDESSATTARGLAHRRDNLESVAVILRWAGRADQIEHSIEAVDVRALAHISALDLVRTDETDPLLSAVSWQEPHAWWGAPPNLSGP